MTQLTISQLRGCVVHNGHVVDEWPEREVLQAWYRIMRWWKGARTHRVTSGAEFSVAIDAAKDWDVIDGGGHTIALPEATIDLKGREFLTIQHCCFIVER